jgi:uncharacterized repeat protein (TIGR03837 family)
MKTQRWDLFCKVIDNFGDIGVCWRLARQLRDEYALNVRLWLDDLSVASRLINGLNPSLNSQIANGVEVCLWSSDEDFVEILPADVVIEAFACELPQPYIRNMVQTKPTWLNLEYLSAEKWVDDFHAQQSIHPATGLKKTFFFPGFTAKTGGLLREHHLKSARAVFKTTEFWGQLGIAPVESSIKISLFCYPHAPIKDLLNSISQGTQPTHCFVPNTTILPVVAEYFGKAALKVGETVSHKQLTITVLPFLSQNEYDHLLWACDLNFVRGEDSWIRALWAAKPFVWQTYQQDENLHLAKLKAFFDTYQPAPCLADFNRAWLEGQIHQAPWDQLIGKLPILKKHAEKQTHEFEKQADLAANLVIFSKNQV